MAGIRHFDESLVLNKALDLFWRQGYGATTMADIAAATGVQRGSLYHAYGDKERIFHLAFDRYAAAFLLAVERALALGDTAAALEALFEAAIVNMAGGEVPRGCLTTKTLTDSANLSPAIQEKAQELLRRFEAMIADCLMKPEHRSALVMPPPTLARLIVTVTRGLAVMQAAGTESPALRAIARSFLATLNLARTETSDDRPVSAG